MNRRHAHRVNRVREALEIVAFFAVLAAVVLFLSLDNVA
jgi:hypothetical protein